MRKLFRKSPVGTEYPIKDLDLVYPLYLNTPMVTSFLAALEGGVAYDSDVTRTKGKQKSTGAEGEGKISIPSSSLLSTLLGVDLRSKLSGSRSAEDKEVVKLARKHTQASLFMRLRYVLQEDDLIVRLSDIDDFSSITHASFVEATGKIARSPLSEVLEALFRVISIAGVDLSPEKASSQSRKGGKRRSKAGGNVSQGGFADEQAAGLQMLERIREDLSISRVVDVVMKPVGAEQVSVVMALALDLLSEGTMETLLSGHFTVLGKVTRVLREGEEEISLYQRTVFSFMDSETLESSFDDLRANPVLNLSETSSYVAAPAIQVIPLAIFV